MFVRRVFLRGTRCEFVRDDAACGRVVVQQANALFEGSVPG